MDLFKEKMETWQGKLVCLALSHHIKAKSFLEYDESGDELEIEFFTGFKDKRAKSFL